MVSVDDVGGFEGWVAQGDGCVVVTIRGEIDMSVTAAFTALVDQAVEVSPHVVFDMAEVTFLDSSALRVLAVTAQRVAGAGSITVRNASPTVNRVFEVTGMDAHLVVEAAGVD